MKRITPYLIPIGFTLFWTLAAGKDFGWDVLNHHLYLPFAWSEGRIFSDVFAAGPQSYQNPIGYYPFFWLVSAGAPSILIGSIFAITHSFNLILIYKLAKLIECERGWTYFSALATGGAAVCPIFLQTAGTSSIDPLTSGLVLLSLLLYMVKPTDIYYSILCGFLLGVATALKLSNAVYLIGFAAIVIIDVWKKLIFFKQAAFQFLGFLLGMVICAWYWMWMLWGEYGNPIFPLYNNIFNSPYISSQPMLASRYVPEDPIAYISRLWEFSYLKQFIYIEGFAPDIRPILLVLLVALGCFVYLHGFICKKKLPRNSSRNRSSIIWRISLFCGASYIFWMMTSGNGRYGTPLLLLISIPLSYLAFVLFNKIRAVLIIVSIICLQFFYFVDSGHYRLLAVAWTKQPYYDVDMSDDLKNTPYLHLALGLQTYASLAVFFAKDGAFSNPIGQVSVPTEGVEGNNLAKLLKNWEGKTRILIRADAKGSAHSEDIANLYRQMLGRLSLDVDWDDCLDIDIKSNQLTENLFVDFGGALSQKFESFRPIKLLSCSTISSSINQKIFQNNKNLADEIFKILEVQCPSIYGPSPFLSERGVGLWQRFYANTDTIVTVHDNGLIIAQHGRSNVDRFIGNADQIAGNNLNINCKHWVLTTPE